MKKVKPHYLAKCVQTDSPESYCRNFDKSNALWCYANGTSESKQLCSVPPCDPEINIKDLKTELDSLLFVVQQSQEAVTMLEDQKDEAQALEDEAENNLVAANDEKEKASR